LWNRSFINIEEIGAQKRGNEVVLEMGVRSGGKKKRLEVELWTFHPEPKEC
jgi:hypothetical protein